MNFIDAIRTCFSNYVGFSGRASRSEFWFFFLFQLLMGIAAAVLDRALVAGGQKLFTALVSLAFFLPGLAVTVRRLHDVDHRGWWLLLPLPFIVFGAVIIPVATLNAIPVFIFIGAVLAVAGLGLAILLFVWYCTRGTAGPNRFGPNPLANA
jgi:uncharacterized membrane protein YhaH (DUF805 family)